MAYRPIQPKNLGVYYIHDIDLKEIIAFIDWRFYFLAWRLSGRYDGIEFVHNCASCQAEWLLGFDEKARPKAEEALKLFRDTQEMLREIAEKKSLQIHAAYALLPARAQDDDILITFGSNEVVIPTLRQQIPSADQFCYSLSDFLTSNTDYLGIFANTVTGAETLATEFDKSNDIYKSLIIKTLSDRFAEATAEWLHWKVRTEFWGYAPEENLSIPEMLKTQYKGIRPAVGYPSLPDLSIIFELDKILDYNKIGISLTEHGAMFPSASVSGLYFAHPQSKYFIIGKISEEQLHDYARRKKSTANEVRKWLTANL